MMQILFASVSYYARSCGFEVLVKSPNLNKEYTRHGAVHIRGLPIRVVYSGVWRYLQECRDGSPLSITNNIIKLSKPIACGELL